MESSMRGHTVATLLALFVLSSTALAQAPRSGRPNVIFIMSDDHAAHAIGAYGSRVNQTPNLDRLAREGALLTSVFATNSICTPSRAAILTGQYSHINGVTMFNRFDSSRMTVARLLQQSGFTPGSSANGIPEAIRPASTDGRFCPVDRHSAGADGTRSRRSRCGL